MNDSATMTNALVNLGVLAGCAVVAFGGVIWFLKREKQ
jgi:hypothetical protein